jgi:hypothetical protein
MSSVFTRLPVYRTVECEPFCYPLPSSFHSSTITPTHTRSITNKMVALSSLTSLALLGSSTALPSLLSDLLPKRTGCGEVNVVLTGLPPNHPTVIEQGWNPTMVANALTTDGEAVIAAGYNYLSVLFGPEVDEEATLGAALKGTYWSVAVTGFGVRGANSSELTHHMESKSRQCVGSSLWYCRLIIRLCRDPADVPPKSTGRVSRIQSLA